MTTTNESTINEKTVELNEIIQSEQITKNIEEETTLINAESTVNDNSIKET